MASRPPRYARRESVASTIQAKPWAILAGIRLRRTFVEHLDPRLRVVPGRGVPDITVDPERAPRLVVIEIGPGPELPRQAIDYAGQVRQVSIPTMSLPPSEWTKKVDEVLDALAPEDLLLFLFPEPGLQGRLEHQAAFAIQPSVGCVVPFRNLALPLAYARSPHHDDFAPIHRSPHAFAHLTGNIPAGGLHGMMIRCGVLRQLGGLSGVLVETGVIEAAGGDAVGVAVSLACLRHGLRNVSVCGVTCDRELTAVQPLAGRPRAARFAAPAPAS
jgi:hypothetical protein